MLQDIRYALRVLLKNRGFTAVAVIALALGIGANTAIFSIVNAVLLSPLPYEDPDTLVRVWGSYTQAAMAESHDSSFDFNHSPNDFLDWREQAASFAGIAAFTSGSITMTGRDEPLRLRCPVVSSDFFSVLNARPALGRFFIREDERNGKHRVLVLSHGLWQREFGADPNVAGQTVTLNTFQYTIVGVAPADFKHPIPSSAGEPDVWRPLMLEVEPGNRGGHFLKAIARLGPGVSIEEAQAEIAAISGQLEQQYPETNKGRGARLGPLHESFVGKVRPALMVMLAAVGFVLLIACANVANLMLARATARGKEMAIRVAIGASRSRIIRQLLTESILMAVAGGFFGLLLALWATDFFVSLSAGGIPRLDEIRIDGRMLGFTLLVSVLTGVVFGIAPALHVSKPDLNASLKEGGRSAGAGPRGNRLRNVLVVSEVALSLMLLVGAGLMIKSFWRLQQVDMGFSPENLLALEIVLPQARYPDRKQAAVFHEQLVGRIQALPGVQSAGAVNMLPLSGSNSCDSFWVEGWPPLAAGEEPCTEIRSVTADYFRTMGIPLIRGRQLTERDNKDAPLVVVINAKMAERFFPDQDPIGKRINLNGPTEPVWQEIVGVVGDVKHFGLEAEPRPELYQPHLQAAAMGMALVVRGAADVEKLAGAVRAEVRAMDRDLPLYNVKTMQELVSDSIAQPRFRTVLLGIFSALALVMAVMGIYGVMAYGVSQRTNELGIRMALGARPADILKLVLRQGVALTLIGVAAGLCGAFALTRLIEGLLYGVSSTDPLTYIFVSLMLGAVAVAACYIPARRATKVDPMVALRYE